MKTKKKHSDSTRQQIIDRVVAKPGEKPNPNAPKRKHLYRMESPGYKREHAGVTLTAIRKSVNEPLLNATIMLDAEGNPTGEQHIESVKPDHRLKEVRRAAYEGRGLLGPFPTASERRKTRRRNGRYAAVGTKGTKKPKKSWHKNGDRLTAAARKEDAKTSAKGKGK